MIPYNKQTIDENDIASVIKTMRSDYITRGEKTKEFEEAIAEYCDVKYAVTFNSGTSALLAAYKALAISGKYQMITTPITFCSAVNTAILANATPRFADIHLENGLMDEDDVKGMVDRKTSLIVPMDYGGHPCNMEKISKMAEENSLFVIEDACHSLGATYKGKKVGSFADMTIFSLHAIKTITTGEGGIVATDDKNYCERLERFRNHGLVKTDKWMYPYDLEELGLNFHMTEIQAALGLSQLKKIDEFCKKRRYIASKYARHLSKINDMITLPKEKKDVFSSYHLYPIRLKVDLNRDWIIDRLRKRKIIAAVHYVPVYWLSWYVENYNGATNCPKAEEFYRTEISLPCYPSMYDEDIEYVATSLKEIINELKISKYY